MTAVPAEAVAAAAAAIHRLLCPVHDEDAEPQDVRAATAALEAAAPLIAAAAVDDYRQRIAKAHIRGREVQPTYEDENAP